MAMKPLPKLKTPEYKLRLPITNTDVIYKPYTVGDERTLIMAAAARESDSQFYVHNTLKVIRDSVVNDVDITSLPAVEVKLLLLNQRAISSGEEVEFIYKDKHTFMDIKKVTVDRIRTPEEYLIDVGQDIHIKMKELTFEDELLISVVDGIEEPTVRANMIYDLIIKCIDSIYDQNDVWKVGVDVTADDLMEFVKSIPSTHSKILYEFISDAPVLSCVVHAGGEEFKITGREVDFLALESVKSPSGTTTD